MILCRFNGVEYPPGDFEKIPDPVVREKVQQAANVEHYYGESCNQLLSKRNSTDCSEKQRATTEQLDDTQILTKQAYKTLKEDLRKNHNAEIQSEYPHLDNGEFIR